MDVKIVFDELDFGEAVNFCDLEIGEIFLDQLGGHIHASVKVGTRESIDINDLDWKRTVTHDLRRQASPSYHRLIHKLDYVHGYLESRIFRKLRLD